MPYAKLLPNVIRKIQYLKRVGLTNREIQSRLGYSLSTISKYTSNRRLGSYDSSYSVNPGFTRRSSFDEEILNYRRTSIEESHSNNSTVLESLVDVDKSVPGHEYAGWKMNVIELLMNEINELQKRIENLEETVDSLAEKLQDLNQ